MAIRLYSDNDRAACAALFDGNTPAFFAHDERAQFLDFLDDLPGPYLVLEADGQIVACGGWAREKEQPDRAALCWGMVGRQFQGHGFGAALLVARLEQIRADTSIKDVRIDTSQKVAGFFAKYGFVPGTIVPDFYAPGLDKWEMCLRLS